MNTDIGETMDGVSGTINSGDTSSGGLIPYVGIIEKTASFSTPPSLLSVRNLATLSVAAKL